MVPNGHLPGRRPAGSTASGVGWRAELQAMQIQTKEPRDQSSFLLPRVGFTSSKESKPARFLSWVPRSHDHLHPSNAPKATGSDWLRFIRNRFTSARQHATLCLSRESRLMRRNLLGNLKLSTMPSTVPAGSYSKQHRFFTDSDGWVHVGKKFTHRRRNLPLNEAILLFSVRTVAVLTTQQRDAHNLFDAMHAME